MKPRPAPALDDGERIMPTAERFQHDRITYGEETIFSELGGRGTSKALTHRVKTQRVIDALWMAGKLDDRQFKAAAKFWALYHASGMEGARAIDLNRTGGGSGGPLYAVSDRACSARQEWNAAFRLIPMRLSGVFVWVVVSDSPLRQWVARRGGRTASRLAEAREQLCDALDILAGHWRL